MQLHNVVIIYLVLCSCPSVQGFLDGLREILDKFWNPCKYSECCDERWFQTNGVGKYLLQP